ncbi:MAG: DUF721 domain-containing protein [Thermoleophilaceae bacterium]|nr:DUF721 domain-containing protein [Thermoleophilaceae bacterium]
MTSSRRPAPRPLAPALEQVLERLAPRTVLARAQGRWESLVGPTVAAESTPVAERDGVLTVRCSSSLWAQELELLAPQLLAMLESELGSGAIRRLRFVTGSRRA